MKHAAAFFVLAVLGSGACSRPAADAAKVTPVPGADVDRRARMVETQIVARGVRNPRVLAAMRKVTRRSAATSGERIGGGAIAVGGACAETMADVSHSASVARNIRAVQEDRWGTAGYGPPCRCQSLPGW